MPAKWCLYFLLQAAALVTEQSTQAQDNAADRLLTAITRGAESNRTRLDFDGKIFSGLAWGQLLAEGRDAQPVFWGVDYEVLGDRQLIKALENLPGADAAKAALADPRPHALDDKSQLTPHHHGIRHGSGHVRVDRVRHV